MCVTIMSRRMGQLMRWNGPCAEEEVVEEEEDWRETTSFQVRPRHCCLDPPAYSYHSLFQPCPSPQI